MRIAIGSNGYVFFTTNDAWHLASFNSNVMCCFSNEIFESNLFSRSDISTASSSSRPKWKLRRQSNGPIPAWQWREPAVHLRSRSPTHFLRHAAASWESFFCTPARFRNTAGSIFDRQVMCFEPSLTSKKSEAHDSGYAPFSSNCNNVVSFIGVQRRILFR